MPKETLTVISPVFNEEEVISDFYEQLSDTLSKIKGIEWNILFVVDPGEDQTESRLLELSKKNKRVKILFLSRRFGHQMSLVAGIDHCDSDIIVMMDSDLQHPPELIHEMLDNYKKGYEVVYTIRDFPSDPNIFKRAGSKLFYKLMAQISEIDLIQGEADFRLISKRVADVFKSSIRERNQFLRGLFNWVGYKRVGIHFQPNSRVLGRSKYNFSTMLGFANNGIISFSKKPLQLSISMGFIFACFGFLFSAFVFFEYFINDQIPSGWTTLGILISFYSAVQLIVLGLMGQYIGSIYDEVKGRPLYLIDKKINIDESSP